MVVVENYFRKVYVDGGVHGRFAKEDDFFSLNDEAILAENKAWFDGAPLMYVPGVLDIVINGVKALDFHNWDYPYWIYGQLCGFTDQILSGKEFKLLWLEADAYIEIVPLNKNFCIFSFILGGKVLSRMDCSRNQIYTALINAALQTFQIAGRYGGENVSEEILSLETCLAGLK